MKKMMVMAAVCLMAVMAFAAQCAATTKKGTQCKRQASPGSAFCWQHGGTTKAERGEGRTTSSPERATRRSGSEEVETAADEIPAAKPSRRRASQAKAEAADDAPAAKPSRRKARKEAGENTDAKGVEAGMCAAMTKAGTPCKRKAKEGSRYCAQHAARKGEAAADEVPAAKPSRRRASQAKAEAADDAPAAKPSRRKARKEGGENADARGGTCQGKSKNGEPCKRKAKPGSRFCWQHEK